MKIIGIIAEYNPFHNGHAYQIEKIRRETGADYIVIAMSGDFVQRGAPALTDKYTRTEMALRCGADLVFELPPPNILPAQASLCLKKQAAQTASVSARKRTIFLCFPPSQNFSVRNRPTTAICFLPI